MALYEELDPELRRRLYPNGTIHHWLMVWPLADSTDVARINAEFRKKKAYLKEAEQKGDWSDYIRLIERPYRIDALRKVLRRIRDPMQAAQLVADVWTDSESIRQHRASWIKVWQCLPDPHLTMDRGERAAFAALPDRLHVFRGERYQKRGAHGLSWTLDHAKAQWFARRILEIGGKGFVVSGLVHKHNVLAYFTGRSESEIVALPQHIQDLIVRPIGHEGGS